MHAAPEDLTVLMEDGAGGSIRGTDFGQFAASFNRFVAGTDLGPLLSQLPGGDCAVPHWGYVIEGSVTVHYAGCTYAVAYDAERLAGCWRER